MHSRCYRPKTIVEYDSKAFIAKENKIRITFDSRIVSVESCFDLFSPRLNMNPVLDPYCVVLPTFIASLVSASCAVLLCLLLKRRAT